MTQKKPKSGHLAGQIRSEKSLLQFPAVVAARERQQRRAFAERGRMAEPYIAYPLWRLGRRMGVPAENHIQFGTRLCQQRSC